MTGELSWVDAGFLGGTGPGERGEVTALHVGEQQGRTELCPGMGHESAESLWARMGGQPNTGTVVVGVCYRLSDQEEVDEASSGNWSSFTFAVPNVHQEGLEPPIIC